MALLSPSALTDVRLPAIFSDHMVLQRNAKISIWGWADVGEAITVSIAEETQSTITESDGKWSVSFDSPKTPGPLAVTVKGRNEIVVNDVLLGEVWLASGQSNMVAPVSSALNFARERETSLLPLIRVFKEQSTSSHFPRSEPKGQWVVCSPNTVAQFPATAFFFGRELHRELDTPIGLITSAMGGTPIEAWIPAEVQRAAPELQPYFKILDKIRADKTSPEAIAKYEKALKRWQERSVKDRQDNRKLRRRPKDPRQASARMTNVGGLFNGKIAPLIPYGIRGVIWYQGESNTMRTKAPFYRHQLPLLVTSWRSRWGMELPFAWVQLPGFRARGANWPLVREAMLKTLSIPSTGMAITIDIGEEDNIHPKNKQDVSHRLALWALAKVYGKQVPAISGPLPTKHDICDADVIIAFNHAEQGLKTLDGGQPRGFVIAGADRVWRSANARIDGHTVVVSSPEVTHPAAVRYAWENFPDANLVNSAGLPASPFRTDDWNETQPRAFADGWSQPAPSANSPERRDRFLEDAGE